MQFFPRLLKVKQVSTILLHSEDVSWAAFLDWEPDFCGDACRKLWRNLLTFATVLLDGCSACFQDTIPLSESPYLMHPVESKTNGLYSNPVAILDFASLYPTLYRAYNLCYTTLLHPDDAPSFPKEHITETPVGDYQCSTMICCDSSQGRKRAMSMAAHQVAEMAPMSTFMTFSHHIHLPL